MIAFESLSLTELQQRPELLEQFSLLDKKIRQRVVASQHLELLRPLHLKVLELKQILTEH